MNRTARTIIAIAVLQTIVLATVAFALPGFDGWVAAAPALIAAIATLGIVHARMHAHTAELARTHIQMETLRASEARYREYAEASADWYWESDAEQRFTFFSESFETVLGITAATLIGRRSWDVVSERMEIDSQQWEAHIAALTAQMPFRDFKYWLEDTKGRARWVKFSGIPRFAPDGSFIGYRGTGSDITAAVESAHRMHMLNRAVEQSPVSIVITDLNAKIQYVNDAFLNVTGYAMDEVIGQNPRVLKSDQTAPELYLTMWNALTSGEKWEGELINRRKNGDLYWEFASIQPIQNLEGVVTNYLAIKTDITEQKRNADRLDALVEELRRSNEELEQFAYVASHDLRQPLRMISAYLGMLQKRLGPSLDQDCTTFFSFATDGAKRLDGMIVDLLEYSRIGRVTAALTPVSLDEAMEAALRHLEVAITENNAEISKPDSLPRVNGDLGELVRLFQNLVGNALKYHAPDRPPKVEILCRETRTEWILGVKDNGIGIEKDDLQRVFGIFQRLVTREQYEGTGIGLAVCRKIAERHGGRIWVESELGQGSTFLIALPKAAR